MAKFLALLAIALTMSGNCFAQQYCAVRVDLSDRHLSVDGSSCSANLATFWQAVERDLPKPLPRGVRSIAITGYDSPDFLSAMAIAFGATCQKKAFHGQAFVKAFGELPEAQVRSQTLARLRPILDSVDNYYVLKESPGGIAIRSPGCKYKLLRPVLYYRVTDGAPNNSFKPRPLRGSAAW
jgi:hypothetical protein